MSTHALSTQVASPSYKKKKKTDKFMLGLKKNKNQSLALGMQL